MEITYENKTLTPAAWSRIVGISESTIHGRILRGWTPKEALTIPIATNDNKITKNDAEMWLNDLAFEGLPVVFRQLLGKPVGSLKKYGQFIRANYRKEFDQWFNDEYSNQISNK